MLTPYSPNPTASPETSEDLGKVSRQFPSLLRQVSSHLNSLISPHGIVVYQSIKHPGKPSIFVIGDRHWQKASQPERYYPEIQLARLHMLEALYKEEKVRHIAMEGVDDNCVLNDSTERFLRHFRSAMPDLQTQMLDADDEFLLQLFGHQELRVEGTDIFAVRHLCHVQGFEDPALIRRYTKNLRAPRDTPRDPVAVKRLLCEMTYLQEARSAHALDHVVNHETVKHGGSIALNFGFLHLHEISRFLDSEMIDIPAVTGVDGRILPGIRRPFKPPLNFYILYPTAHYSRMTEQLAFVR